MRTTVTSRPEPGRDAPGDAGDDPVLAAALQAAVPATAPVSAPPEGSFRRPAVEVVPRVSN